jgi:hypothetical protein
MPALIGERHRAARKAARRAKRTGAATDYHRLRIRCKRLRYALEFASGLYDGELKGFVRQMTRLQDALGSMQDAAVASSRLQVIALTEEGSSLSRAAIFAMGGVARQYRSEAEHLLGDMPELVQLLQGKEWKRARSLMELRQKAAAPLAHPPAAASAEARQIGVVGRARPALVNSTSSSLATSRPGVSPRPSPEPEMTGEVSPLGTDTESAPVTSEASVPATEGDSAPLGEPHPANGSTITPIRRQVAPS